MVNAGWKWGLQGDKNTAINVIQTRTRYTGQHSGHTYYKWNGLSRIDLCPGQDSGAEEHKTIYTVVFMELKEIVHFPEISIFAMDLWFFMLKMILK